MTKILMNECIYAHSALCYSSGNDQIISIHFHYYYTKLRVASVLETIPATFG